MINKQIYEFPIVYTNPIPKIAMGWGAHETTADECKRAGIKKALIVTSGLRGTGIVDEIKTSLEHNGIATDIYDKVTSNPKDYQVMEAYQAFMDSKSDGVVAIGGGSSIDTGKGLRVVAANGGGDVTNFIALIDPPWMETLKKLKELGIKYLNLGGSETVRLHEFKKKFRPIQERYSYWLVYDKN